MSKKVNLLWVSQFAPVSKDPEAGTCTLNYYFRKFCEDENFNIKLIALAKPNLREAIEQENANVDHEFIYWSSGIYDRIKNVANLETKYNPFNRYAGLVNNSDVSKIKRIVKRLINENYEPDVIILDWTQMVFLASYFKKMFPNSFVVASEVDVTFVGFERKVKYYSSLERLKWKIKLHIEKNKELSNLKLCDLVLPQNKENAFLLDKEGINSDKIKWLVPFYQSFISAPRNPISKNVVFYGAMNRPENYLSAIWFIENVMPLIDDLNVTFVVVGNKPDEKLLSYASEKVKITGFVDTVEPYFSQGLCFAAPLVLGAGIKVKVLEALSAGIPVLTNEIGIEGISIKRNLDYYHCETAQEYADAIRKITSVGDVFGVRAREILQKDYSFEECSNSYKEWILNLVNGEHVDG